MSLKQESKKEPQPLIVIRQNNGNGLSMETPTKFGLIRVREFGSDGAVLRSYLRDTLGVRFVDNMPAETDLFPTPQIKVKS